MMLTPISLISAADINPCLTIIASTLLPLEMHRDVLGLDENLTIMKNYPSPFDEYNSAHIIVEGHTTKYSKRKTENQGFEIN